MNLASLLHNAARTFGGRPAISVGDHLKFSYADLQSSVTRLAGGLSGLGFPAGGRVALVMTNHPSYFEILFAIWHAGLVAVPLSAKLHPREMAFIFEDCAVSVCFVTGDLAESVTSASVGVTNPPRVVCVDDSEYAKLFADPVNQARSGRDDLAWIFYTSGTTGRPKGAMLSHFNLQLMAWSYLCDYDFVTDRDCMVHVAPQSHAGGLLALTHLGRASHNVLPASGGFDTGELTTLIDTYENVSFFVTPTMLRRLLESSEIGRCRIENIRTILCGAAPVYIRDVERSMAAFGPKLCNGYGQGECPCMISAMTKRLYEAASAEGRSASVGIARTGSELRIVDDADCELPIGEVGEILVRSYAVMQGYWNQPEASACALVDGWLHTGDLGAVDDEGYLFLKDRTKDLIISGGSNIYPREVEDVLLKDTAVAEVAIVGRPNAEWGESAVAFVVCRPGIDPPTPASLDRLCLDNLARYKRPRSYHFVPSLPKNSTGKVLKNELRAQLKRLEYSEEC